MKNFQIHVIGIIILILGGWPTFGAQPDVSGVIYSDFTYSTFDGENSFNIERVYVNARGALSRQIHYRVTSDIDEPVPAGTGYRLILKYAYLSWTHNTIGTVTAGMLGTNAFKVQEDTWGLRYLFESALDQFDYAPSADIGLSYDRTLYQDFSVSLQVTNGGGYQFAERNPGKRVHFRLLYGPEDLHDTTGVNLGLYGSWEQQSLEETYILAAFAGTRFHRFTIGGEIARRYYHQLFTDMPEDLIYSVYGRMKLTGKFQAFGRFDYFWYNDLVPDGYLTIGERQNWYILGVEYSGLTGVKIAPNLLYSVHDKVRTEDTLFLRLNFEFRW
ncbi:MAG TPA: hypothetical protein VKA68_11090 [bacterium]|nr:hypothetical protein [bacterium]